MKTLDQRRREIWDMAMVTSDPIRRRELWREYENLAELTQKRDLRVDDNPAPTFISDVFDNK